MLQKYTNKLTVGYGNMVFIGLKFFSTLRNTYTKDYYEKLLDEGGDLNKAKYLVSMHNELDERIHIKLSYSFIYMFLSIIFLIITIICMITGVGLYSLIPACIGLSCKLIQGAYNRYAKLLIVSKEIVKDIVDLFFQK